MKSLFTNKLIYLISTVFLLLMVVATLYDYQISLAVYDQQNLYGRIFAAYGGMTFPVTVLLAFVYLLKSITETDSKKAKNWIYSVSVLFIGTSIEEIITVWEVFPTLVSIVVYIFINLLCLFLFVKTIDSQDKEKLRKYGLTILVCLVTSFLVYNVFKFVWCRPRMRTVEGYGIAFMPWYKIDWQIKKEAINQFHMASTEFRSFVSGHTCNCSAVLWLSSISLFSSKLKNKQILILILSLTYIALVAFSRVVIGAHFLSDVSCGFIIFFIVINIFIRKKNLN